MKLAFVAPRYPGPGVVGGCETLLANLAHHSAAAGHEVSFLTTCATDPHSWENTLSPCAVSERGLTIQYFPVDSGRDVSEFLRLQAIIDSRAGLTPEEESRWIANSVHSTPLIEHARNAHYDRIVVGPYLFGLTHALIHAIPSGAYLLPALHDEPFAYLSIMRRIFDKATRIVFNSVPEQQLARRLYGVDESKARVVGMGIDMFDADPARAHAKFNLAGDYFIYCGRREFGKGTPLLLDYFDLFLQRTKRPVSLVMTGTGRIDPSETLAPHLIDLGYVSEQDKHDAMAGALGFLHAGTNESLGIVILESLLAGAPALVHQKSEALRYLCEQSGGGLWFRHYPDFESILLRLLDDESLRSSMAVSGSNYVARHYSWDAVGARLVHALD